jgi:hypothetical protein
MDGSKLKPSRGRMRGQSRHCLLRDHLRPSFPSNHSEMVKYCVLCRTSSLNRRLGRPTQFRQDLSVWKPAHIPARIRSTDFFTGKPTLPVASSGHRNALVRDIIIKPSPVGTALLPETDTSHSWPSSNSSRTPPTSELRAYASHPDSTVASNEIGRRVIATAAPVRFFLQPRTLLIPWPTIK